jgi:hypothetical protein
MFCVGWVLFILSLPYHMVLCYSFVVVGCFTVSFSLLFLPMPKVGGDVSIPGGVADLKLQT